MKEKFDRNEKNHYISIILYKKFQYVFAPNFNATIPLVNAWIILYPYNLNIWIRFIWISSLTSRSQYMSMSHLVLVVIFFISVDIVITYCYT